MSKRNSNDVTTISSELQSHVVILGGIAGIMWLTEIIDLILQHRLDQFGIRPQTLIGLRGVFLAPFLHQDFRHLISNTFPFLVMGWFVMLDGIGSFFAVSTIVMLCSGLGVWFFGTPGLHIGASGVVFGYFGFLLSRAYFERSVLSIALSLMVGILYGSLIWGVLPLRYGISWEGHLFGLLGGILAAKWLSDRR
jgi:membrane associated rhomboid family serine protease